LPGRRIVVFAVVAAAGVGGAAAVLATHATAAHRGRTPEEQALDARDLPVPVPIPRRPSTGRRCARPSRC
jgi:hypothetical protein